MGPLAPGPGPGLYHVRPHALSLGLGTGSHASHASNPSQGGQRSSNATWRGPRRGELRNPHASYVEGLVCGVCRVYLPSNPCPLKSLRAC